MCPDFLSDIRRLGRRPATESSDERRHIAVSQRPSAASRRPNKQISAADGELMNDRPAPAGQVAVARPVERRNRRRPQTTDYRRGQTVSHAADVVLPNGCGQVGANRAQRHDIGRRFRHVAGAQRRSVGIISASCSPQVGRATLPRTRPSASPHSYSSKGPPHLHYASPFPTIAKTLTNTLNSLPLATISCAKAIK